MAEPLNNPGSVRFFLDFNDKVGDQEIAEPWGWDGAIFELLQDSERLGRDVFFAKTELGFRSDVQINKLTNRFSQIMDRYNISGFESNILFILVIQNVRYVVGELDFVESVTDGLTYFNCKIIQQAEEVALKRKLDVNIDLFSDKDTNNAPIVPVETDLLLWQAVPLNQFSTWQQPGPFSVVGGSSSGSGSKKVYVSPTTIPIDQNIEDTIYPENFSQYGEYTDIILADNTLTECKLSIQTSEITLRAIGSDLGYAQASLWIKIGTDVDNIFQSFKPVTLLVEGEEIVVYPDTLLEFEFSVPRNQRVFVYWFFDCQTGNDAFTAELRIPNSTIRAESTSLSISSVVTVVRFIDAFRQVVSSIGGYTVEAPRFDQGGEYYDQWITNGKLLRQIEDEPFNVSLKSLLAQLKEINGDYQILDENTLFLGIYEDFYQDIQIEGQSFEMLPSTAYQQLFSERYTVNKVNLKAKKYEEDSNEQGSRFGIHSQIDVLLPNKKTENTKDIVVEYVRDGFLIEKVRKEATLVEEETASIDDEGIMIIDGVYKNFTFSEYMLIIQVASQANPATDLSLINDNSFNWTLIGIDIGATVRLQNSQNNGYYTVITIESNILTVRKINQDTTNAATEVILFTYTVTVTSLTQRTNEGFQDLSLPFYANGIFSNKRTLEKYYGNYMRSAALYRPNDIYLTQRYIHNAAWVSLLDTEQFPIIEGENIDPSTLSLPLVYPLEITTEVIVEFSVYWNLMQGMKSSRGYLTIQDNLGSDIKIFPSSLTYNWGNNLLTIIGLKKYEL